MGRFVAGTLRWAASGCHFLSQCRAWRHSQRNRIDLSRIHPESKPLFKYDSYPAAWTAAQESNKPILVYVTMPQCPHCTKMLDTTYGSAEVTAMVTELI